MLSTADKKLLRKLRQKKYRWQESLFVAEGPKVILDLIDSGLKPLRLWAVPDSGWPEAEECSGKELSEVSSLISPNQAIAIFPFPKKKIPGQSNCLVLDALNDPGNLGTLIRTADWFGFECIFCLPGTADVYNPKTVQSTMGSLGRVDISYASAEAVSKELENHRVLVADMQGIPLKEVHSKTSPVALILGSESHGPGSFWQGRGEAVTIPKSGSSKIDSLNVAVAGAILMHHLA